MKSKKTYLTKKIFLLLLIITVFIVLIFLDWYAKSKPINHVTMELNHNEKLELVNPNSISQSYDEIKTKLNKQKKISNLLIEFDGIEHASVTISDEVMDSSSAVSIVVGLSQDLDEMDINIIVNMLISEIKNLKKNNIIIMDKIGNLIYPLS